MSNIGSLKEIKKGVVIVHNDEPCQVLEASFLRMQQRKPVMQTKLRGLQSGKTFEYSFKQGENIESADLDKKSANFMYNEGDSFEFMDNETYEQISLDRDALGDKVGYLTAGTKVDLLYYSGQLISADIPIKVELKITETEPGVRGDTAQGSVMKPATLETGLIIQVPIFVKQGDVIRVNTEKGEYVERV